MNFNKNEKMSKTIEESEIVNAELIPENILYEIFETQYDDLFCKILKISEKSFLYFLHQQVIFNLLIIKKKVDQKILTAFQELFSKRYKENVKSMKKNFEIIKKKEENNSNDLTYLDVTKCYIHCHKCYDIIHKCGSKLIVYDEYTFCIKCNNVYNKNQIMLLCPECKKNYFTKLRKPILNNSKKYDKLFILKYKKYHCPTDKEEKIKCIKCSNNLYFRLSQNNQRDEDINIIYCIKCKLKYNLKDVFFKCKICLKNFKCQAKIFRDFPHKKRKLLFLIHTLLRNKNAIPNLTLCTKNCTCDLNSITEYNHKEDNGIFLEGVKNNKKSVVCNACYQNLKFNEVNWHCPTCGESFNYKNRNKSKNKNKTTRNSSSKELLEKDKNINVNKIPILDININDIFKNKNESYSMIMNSEDNNNKYIINRLDKKNSINYDIKHNMDKLKKIFVGGAKNIPKNNRSFLIVKSKSKNDIIRKKSKNNSITKLKKKNDELQEKTFKNLNMNVIKDKDKDKNNDDNGENNGDNIEIKDEENIIVNEKNEIKKENNSGGGKKIDTNSIFNNIKNNILNLDETYNEAYNQKNEFIKQIRASGKKTNNCILGEGVINSFIQNNKNDNYVNYLYDNNNNYYNINNNINISDYYEKEKSLNEQKDQIKNEGFINSDASSSIQRISSIDDYDNVPNERRSKKQQINYAKKIYFFNGKYDKDCKSYDETVNNIKNVKNVNTKKYNIKRDMFKKYIKYTDDKNNYDMFNNMYMNGNNSHYIFPNENNFSNVNSNYNTYYYNYDNYQENNQLMDLYNFNSENYSIIKIIGKGSNGKIYLVQDLQTNQKFALKSILIDNEIELKRIEEEYNLIYKITCENPDLKIINIYGIEIRKINNYNFFLNVLMEKGEHDWENEIINRKKSNIYYTEQELLNILFNLVGTFAYLQQKGISHRDVKPQNILCFGDNEYKICDFGEAKYQNQNNKKTKQYGNLDISNQTIRGTEMYMSPILFRAVKFKPDSLTKYNSFKSDVFSLGLCFLYASSLNSEILLKVRETNDMEKIGIIVNRYLGDKYSQEYINILMYMIQMEEAYRPDFIELNSLILFGNY